MLLECEGHTYHTRRNFSISTDSIDEKPQASLNPKQIGVSARGTSASRSSEAERRQRLGGEGRSNFQSIRKFIRSSLHVGKRHVVATSSSITSHYAQSPDGVSQ
jgi:hypothetical protein